MRKIIPLLLALALLLSGCNSSGASQRAETVAVSPLPQAVSEALRAERPNPEALRTVDLSVYETMWTPRTFTLEPQDRSWVLRSETEYDAAGRAVSTIEYQYDADGQAYYKDGDRRVDAGRIPQDGRGDPTEFLKAWQVLREEFDGAGRITAREAQFPGDPSNRELLRFYYRPDAPEERGVIGLCAMTRTMITEDGSVFDENGDPIPVYTAYEITNYDEYGNETDLWIEAACAMYSDQDGYLQLILSHSAPNQDNVFRVDRAGRPLWSASYTDGALTGYHLWTYENRKEEGT